MDNATLWDRAESYKHWGSVFLAIAIVEAFVIWSLATKPAEAPIYVAAPVPSVQSMMFMEHADGNVEVFLPSGDHLVGHLDISLTHQSVK